MKLREYKDVYKKTSGKLSDINRNIIFSGIALIWIFTSQQEDQHIPDLLITPSILLAVALVCDMIQYIYKTIAFYIIYKCREKRSKNNQVSCLYTSSHCCISPKEEVNNDEDKPHKECIVLPIWIFFWVKIALVIISYYFIILFLIKTLLYQ